MRERQRDDHAVAGDAAPALGEVPEQRLQPAVHARELGDRLRGGEAQRALAEAVEQRRGDLRVARHLGREAAVEHGDGERREHRPHGVDGQQAGAAGALPRAARRSPGPSSSALTWSATTSSRDEHAVEHEQADVVGARARRAATRPTGRRAAGGCARPVRARPRCAAAREQERRDRDRLRAAGSVSVLRAMREGGPATYDALPRNVGFQTPAIRDAQPTPGIRRDRPCGGSAPRPCRRPWRPAACRRTTTRARSRRLSSSLGVRRPAARGRFEPLEHVVLGAERCRGDRQHDA